MKRIATLSALVAAVATFATAGHALAEQACPAVGKPPPIPLPHVAAAIRANEQVIIVAIGSSSTRSWMSSNPAHSYPARLQEDLSQAWPTAHIAVINRGINGQDAAEEVPRLDADVLAMRPQAVIWQVGANGVLRATSTDVFKKLVTAGIARLKAAKLDVVLMDNQRSPAIMDAPDFRAIDQSLVDLTTENQVSLFRRSHLMDAWKDGGMPYETFVSSDHLHLNDYGYRCVADALATALDDGMHEEGASAQLQVSSVDQAKGAAAMAATAAAAAAKK